MCLSFSVLKINNHLCASQKKNSRSLQGSARFSQLVEELLKIIDAFELDTGMQCKCHTAPVAMLEGLVGKLDKCLMLLFVNR